MGLAEILWTVWLLLVATLKDWVLSEGSRGGQPIRWCSDVSGTEAE